MRLAVLVLAGGSSRRWGGVDKTAADLDGRTVLEHAVRGLTAGAGVSLPDVVVAGPSSHAARPALPGVRWVREDPPGGGPVAGLAAAVAAVPERVALVVVGAGDAPFAGEAVPGLLAEIDGTMDAVLAVDPAGRDQYLLGIYRLEPLRRALEAELAVDDGRGARLSRIVGRLRVRRVPVAARAGLDLDTAADLQIALEHLRTDQDPLDDGRA